MNHLNGHRLLLFAAAVSIAILVVVGAIALRGGSETAKSVELTSSVYIPAGKTRAETLREVERQTGVRLTIPWLPDGMEVTGVRVGVGPEPSRVRTAEISVAGQGKGFGMDQTDRPSDFGDGVAVAGAPAGWTFVRADGGAATSWGLSSDKATWTLSDSPDYKPDDATVLRILLGLAGRVP